MGTGWGGFQKGGLQSGDLPVVVPLCVYKARCAHLTWQTAAAVVSLPQRRAHPLDTGPRVTATEVI